MPHTSALKYGMFGRAMYLDTNAWSELAKGNLPDTIIHSWLSEELNYLVLAPYQLVELSLRSDLGEGLVQIFKRNRTFMVSRGLDEELNGRGSWGMGFDVFTPLEGDREDILDAWLDEFRAKTARRDFDGQADRFVDSTRQWIERSLKEAPGPPPRPWQPHFWRFVDRMVRDRCQANGFIYKPDRLQRQDCYRGSKLQLAVLYERYYLRRKKWVDSDYLDLMHLLELAYAEIVVTERSLAAALNAIQHSIPQLSVPDARNLSWLKGASP